MDNKIKSSEKTIDYTVLNQITEHALKYDSFPDKKEFLKNVSAYEQKIILLNSIKPYDVLSYLNELDLESSKLVLSELNSFEIKKIIDLFTSEDKKSFYNNFSDLSLVNQFIKNDKNSAVFVEALPLNRKIELIDSSKKENSQATKEIYNTLSNEEKEIVSNKITKPEATTILDYVENIDESNSVESDIEQETDIIDLETEKKLLNDQQLIDEKVLEDVDNFKNEFLKTNLQFLRDNYKEFENIDVDKYNLLPEELKLILDKQIEENQLKEEQKLINEENKLENEEEIIENITEVNGEESMTVEEYDKYSIIGNNDSKVGIVSNPDKIEEFKHEVESVELNQIIGIKNNVINNIREDQVKIL